MRFFFDRNWSIYLAAAIRELCKPHSLDVKHLDEMFPKNCPDTEWISALGSQGDWAVVTRDRLRKNPAEREALRRTGLLVFIFTKQWADQKEWELAWALVRWWPRLMSVADTVKSGAFAVPFKFSGGGKMDQIQL